MTSDGPESLNISIEDEVLTCSAEGNPSPSAFQWIEVNARNETHDGHELNLCNTVTFEKLKQATLDLSIDLDLSLTFQCVAKQGLHVRRRSHSVAVNQIKRLCPVSSSPTGYLHIFQSHSNIDIFFQLNNYSAFCVLLAGGSKLYLCQLLQAFVGCLVHVSRCLMILREIISSHKLRRGHSTYFLHLTIPLGLQPTALELMREVLNIDYNKATDYYPILHDEVFL